MAWVLFLVQWRSIKWLWAEYSVALCRFLCHKVEVITSRLLAWHHWNAASVCYSHCYGRRLLAARYCTVTKLELMIVITNQTSQPNTKLIVTSGVLQMSCRKVGLTLHGPCGNLHDGPRGNRNLIRTSPKAALVYIPVHVSSSTSCRGEHWDAKWPYIKLETERVSVLGFDLLSALAASPFPPQHTVSLGSTSCLLSLQQNIWNSLPWTHLWPLPPWPALLGPRTAGKKQPSILTGVEN